MEQSTPILVAAFNARYAHASLGARSLLANLGALRSQAALMEFDLQVLPRTAVEKILAHRPQVVGIGCYIWNIDAVTRVAALLKTVRPDLTLVLGGPEISYESEQQEILQYADHVICGEGETGFPELCRNILGSRETKERILHAGPADVKQLELPYDLYTDEDIARKAIYVEASRGCPFRCEYCMSSIDPRVRRFPEARLLAAFDRLLQRGAYHLKFVDRTFNLDIPFAVRVLDFFRERYRPGLMLHFEFVPEQLPEELLQALSACPPGMVQLEIGVQTFNPDVAARIQRPLDIGRIETNLRRLRRETGVHIHADLIAGLPGEDMESLASGFDRLLALHPQEIQLGILKRLRGAPIAHHTQEWSMVYSPHAPYEVLQTNRVPFEQMQRISRFARFWNLTVNSGHFPKTAPLLWRDTPSPFYAFMHFSDWLYARTETTGNLHMVRLAERLLDYLVNDRAMDQDEAAAALLQDYRRGNRTDVPGFLRMHEAPQRRSKDMNALPARRLPRQSRHLE